MIDPYDKIGEKRYFKKIIDREVKQLLGLKTKMRLAYKERDKIEREMKMREAYKELEHHLQSKRLIQQNLKAQIEIAEKIKELR